MQVSVETTGTLGRRMTVSVPAERIDQEVENRLKSIVRTARISGFRPGKVPLKVVQQRYGRQVHLEVAGDVMSSSLQEALNEQNLRPAGQPKLEPRTVEMGKALEYTADFEVYPEFVPASLAEVEIEKPVCEIAAADIDSMLEKLREQRASWEPVEREAAQGDQVNIDFTGSLDGEVFKGGSASGQNVVLGSQRLIEGFETQLIGSRAGEERTLDLRFPDDYPNTELAGKPVQFNVKINSVAEQRLPPLDDAFAQTLGVQGGLDALRDEVAKNMQRELEQMLASVTKTRAFDRLLEANPNVEVPTSLVDQEIEHLSQETLQQLGAKVQGTGSLPREMFEPRAKRRVGLGLIIGEVVRQYGIQTDPERVRRKIETIAASYENPDEVVKWYYENQEAMSNAQSLVLEEQVMEWVLDQAKVIEKPCSFDELTDIHKALKS